MHESRSFRSFANINSSSKFDFNVYYITLFALLLLLYFPSKVSSQAPTDGCTGLVTFDHTNVLGPSATPDTTIAKFTLPVIYGIPDTYFSSACIRYLDSLTGTLYDIIIKAKMQSTITADYVATISDVTKVMSNDNQGDYFNPKEFKPENEAFSCHCPYGTGSWERTCKKYNREAGFHCVQNSTGIDGGGKVSYNCTGCFVNKVMHEALGCTIGGQTPCHKMDFLETKSYNLYRVESEPSESVLVGVDYYINGVLASSTSFQAVGTYTNIMAGINPAPAFVTGGSFLEIDKDDRDVKEDFHVFYKDNLSQTKFLREQIDNLYYIPTEYLGYYDRDPNKIGFFSGPDIQKLEVEGSALSVKFMSEYSFQKAKPARINRMPNFIGLSDFIKDEYKFINVIGSGNITAYTSNPGFKVTMSETGVLTGNVAFTYQAANQFSAEFGSVPSGISMGPSSCLTRGPTSVSTACNITVSAVTGGFATMLVNGESYKTIQLNVGVNKYIITVEQNDFVDNNLNVCIDSMSTQRVCTFVASVPLTDDLPKEIDNNQENEEDGSNISNDEPTTYNALKHFGITDWVIVVIVIGVVIIMIYYMIKYADCTMAKKKYKAWRKKKELNRKKEELEMEKLLEEDEEIPQENPKKFPGLTTY